MKSILNHQLKVIKPNKSETSEIKSLSKNFIKQLKEEIENSGIDAEVFVGGSFAKNTLLKKESGYDVDIFIRFPWYHENLSDLLRPILEAVCKKQNLKLEILHGSRDYFRIFYNNRKIYFEIIPVTKIKKPKEERNVTDLSYFHVPYVKRKIKGFEDHVLLAKSFFHAQKVYGAETYVRGFSGYGIECLIIHYKTFVKALRELSKVKKGERIIIDIEKHFKRKNDVYFELNENRLHAPIILIDPIYKERNVLAALSAETFQKFQKSARDFLKKPSPSFFVEKKPDIQKMKRSAEKRKAELIHLKIKTDRQAGDIAGTKLKKFADFLTNEIAAYFNIHEKEFEYDESQSSVLYLILDSKKEIIRIGPPLHMKKHVKAFKEEHPGAYEKNNILHAKIKVNFSAKDLIEKLSKERKDVLASMGITELEIL